MPADPADIGRAIRAAATAEWSSTAVKARYPNARDGLAEPGEGYFDALADAQAMADARGALLGTERRRFAVEVGGELWLDPAAGAPTVTLTDGELSVAAPHLVTRIELDLEAERTALELFG